MFPPELIQVITVLGAAGVSIWIISLLTGKRPGLHTHSEVEGLRADKAALWSANRVLQKATEDSNKTLADILEILRDETHLRTLTEILRRLSEIQEGVTGGQKKGGG